MTYADLHLHTYYSDGTPSPEQNIIESAMLGMNVVAITDHDTTAGYGEADKAAKEWGIKLLTGVEVSTIKYHILGYNFNIKSAEFQDFLSHCRDIQEEIVYRRIKKLQEVDMPLSLEKVKQYYPKSRLGKNNIVITILRDPECRAYVLKNLGNKTSEEIFDLYLRNNGIARNIEKPTELSSKIAIDQIHAAGGIAVIAHPFKQDDDPKNLDRLVEEGIDGLEVQPNYGERNEPFIKYAKEKSLLITYGSDYHGGIYLNRPRLSRNGNLIQEFW